MKASKALFKKYLRTNNQKEKHQIEKALVDDVFAMDALEGFQSDANAWKGFEQFDKHKQQKRLQLKITLVSAFVILSVFIGYLMMPLPQTKFTSKVQGPQKHTQIIKIHTQKDIQQMKVAPTQLRISPKQVIIETQEKSHRSESLIEVLDRLEQKPIRQIEATQNKGKSLALKMGRELYIKNLKAVDYRYHRKEEDKSFERPMENVFGEQVLKVPYINLLSQALDDFSKENYKLALLHFDQILEVYPDDANALFYGGMCLYNLDQLTQAESRFIKLQNISFANFSEEGNWYLLHVYKLTKKEAAFSSLRSFIIEQKGFYAQKATLLTFN